LSPIEAKPDEKPQFTPVNEDSKKGFNEDMRQKISRQFNYTQNKRRKILSQIEAKSDEEPLLRQ